MLPQPPPNAEAPPASEEALRSRRFWLGIWMTGVISILVLLVLLFPVLFRSRMKSSQTEAVNNARQIGLALFAFETEYGKFPDAGTIGTVKARTGTSLSFGTKTSNDYFRQLIGSGIVSTETMFYAKTAGSRKPDNNSSGNKALEKGEVGFAYLSGLSWKGNPSRPLAVAPVIPGTDRFDPDVFAGKAIILKMDNSVTSVNISRSGHAMVGGKNVLDPKHPIWAGEKWKLVWPE